MIDRRSPDLWKDLKERKERRDAEYLAGQITARVYEVSLMNYGYSPRDARAELNSLDHDKSVKYQLTRRR